MECWRGAGAREAARQRTGPGTSGGSLSAQSVRTPGPRTFYQASAAAASRIPSNSLKIYEYLKAISYSKQRRVLRIKMPDLHYGNPSSAIIALIYMTV